MATSTSITTTYAGEFAGKYIAAALLEGATIANKGVEVKQNVKYKEVIKTLSTNDIVKDATCDFTDTSTVTLAERILQPKELQVNLELCKKDFRSDWEAVQMGYSAFDNLPPTFTDFFIANNIAKVADWVETKLWQGSGAVTGEFNGLNALLKAASGSVASALTGTTITASNVIDQLGRVVDAIPDTLIGKEDLHIYVPANVMKAYIRALGGFGASGLGANGLNGQGTMWYGTGTGLSFDGVKLFYAPGQASNKMIAAQASNLFFGTGLLSDHNLVKVLDMEDLDGSQNVRFIMRFTAGAQYGIASDIVTYGL